MLTIIKTKEKPVAVFLHHLEDLRTVSDPLASAEPSPVLWGAAATVLTFIPYADSAMVLAVQMTVALVTFDSPTRIAGVTLIPPAGNFSVQVVQPLF